MADLSRDGGGKGGSAVAAGALMVLVPVVFMGCFTALQVLFDYPDILRKPGAEVLGKFAAKAGVLLPLWFGMFASAMAFMALAVCAGGGRGTVVVGVLAGLVQAVGLSRWVFVVPWLAARHGEAGATEREAIVVAFEVMNRLLGVGIGEHMGFLLTGLWTVMWVLNSRWRRPWIGRAGAVFAVGIWCGLLEPTGWAPWAGAVNAIGYTLWSVWLMVAGVLVITRRCELRVD